MIPKGLKVGDTFDYCDGYTYKVTAVIGDQYSVARVGKSSPLKTEVKNEEENDYMKMPYFELKKIAAKRGIDSSGKKEELVKRLLG